MTQQLRALVLGSGFAGKGHTLALRECGVDVVGMVSRTADVVQAVAADLHIPYAGTDWAAALEELKPDIVAIGTPGGAHYEPIMQALVVGCHVYCDKPLAPTANEAEALYQKAQAAAVKTAYAASFCYQPAALYARELVAGGEIGEPQEVECISHYNLNPLIPFGWSHRLDQGGGRLNNNFTHKMAIVLKILDGTPLAVMGETRNDMRRAPVVDGVHDFRERENFAPNVNDTDDQEWETVDSDWMYSVMARVQSPHAESGPVSALFKHGGMQPRFQKDHIAIYGSKGAIFIEEAYAQGTLYFRQRGTETEWQARPIPAHITDALPNVDQDAERNWTQLMREFVADIQGQGVPNYLTFRDGWLFQSMIDAVRRSEGWFSLPSA